MSDGLYFNETDHVYFWNGRPVPNVTSVLKPLTRYDMIAPEVLEVARQKGVAVHRMVELDCKDDLNEDLPEWMLPVLVEWRKFKRETGFMMVESEKRVYHPTYKYAGTLDLFGELTHADCFAFIDVKRSFMAGKAIGMQIAAYQYAYMFNGAVAEMKVARKARRFALRLREDTPYRMQEYEDKGDFQDFLTCLDFKRLQERMK